MASLKLAVATVMRLFLYMCITPRICHKTMNVFVAPLMEKRLLTRCPDQIGLFSNLSIYTWDEQTPLISNTTTPKYGTATKGVASCNINIT